MTTIRGLLLAVVLSTAGCTAVHSDPWVTIDEGFHVTIPKEWRKDAMASETHAATYRGRTGYLTFEDTWGRTYLQEDAEEAISDLQHKQEDPQRLRPGEEVWLVDGLLADFTVEPNDSPDPEDAVYPYIACLRVPHPRVSGNLRIMVGCATTVDLALAKRILHSVTWPKPGAEKPKR